MSELQIVPRRQIVQTPMQSDQGISPRFLLGALRRWWKVVLPTALLLAAAGGTTVYLLFEPVYEASALFRIVERRPYLAFETKEDGPSKLFFQTQMELIHTPLVLAPIIERPEIAKVPEIARQVDKVAYLKKQIKVLPVGESELFCIAYANPDAKSAANVVNAVTESYFKLREQTDQDQNQRISELLSQERDARLKEVMRLQGNVRTLAAQAAVEDPFAIRKKDSSPQEKHPLADLESRLIEVQVERTVLDKRIKAAEEAIAAKRKEKGGPDETLSEQEIAMRDAMTERLVEESEGVRRLKAIIAARRTDLAANEQLMVRGKNSPVLDRLRMDIHVDEQSLARLRDEMRPQAKREAELAIMAKQGEMGTSRIQRITDELDKMRSDRVRYGVLEERLQEQCKKQQDSVKQTSGDTLELGFRLDDLARAERVYELIAQRVVEVQTEQEAPTRVKRMQPEALVPSAPVEVFPYRNMAVVLLVCLGLPFALAVAWERMIGRVTDPTMLERQAKLSVLGEIAHLPVRSPAGHGSASARINRELRLFEESIDSLRTSLTLSTELRDMRILAVTSAANREGKTSVVCQLAVSFARATGKQLLLIDGDMRCPDVHSVFGIDLQPGLAKVLSGDCSLEAAIVPSGNDLVDLLPAGKLEVNPHTLLGNGAWPSLLAQIPSRYRYVLIDTPPVLVASEALVLAKAADATLVCVMRDVSRVDQLRRILARLEAAGSQPVGLVLNGVPTKNYSYRWGDYSYVRS
ncbi:MAG: polysaccharide biosynthesis tyrosine autokinase [Thermoguttaceae bacterium]